MADRSMAKIFAKIGALMGVTWLLALVPYLTGMEELWYVFIIVNGLQGVCIFFSSGITQHLYKIFKNSTSESNTENSRNTTENHSTENNTGNEQNEQ